MKKSIDSTESMLLYSLASIVAATYFGLPLEGVILSWVLSLVVLSFFWRKI